jgi:hypothetical protein
MSTARNFWNFSERGQWQICCCFANFCFLLLPEYSPILQNHIPVLVNVSSPDCWQCSLANNFVKSIFMSHAQCLSVTVAELSKACTGFARSETVIVDSNPTQGMDVWCVRAFFCVCAVLCLGWGLATSWSPIQGVLTSVNDQETGKSALCSKVGASSQMGAKRKKKMLNV